MDKLMTLTLEFLDDGESHDDITFQLNSFKQICDSYYFGLDDAIPDSDPHKIGKTLTLLIDQWISAVEKLAEGKEVCLPFDFSDEYTGCVQVALKDNTYVLTPGTSSIAGYAFYPSTISDFILTGDFEVHSSGNFSVGSNRTELLAALHKVKESLATIS